MNNSLQSAIKYGRIASPLVIRFIKLIEFELDREFDHNMPQMRPVNSADNKKDTF